MADTRIGEVQDFANALARHIQEYTIPQYGDKGKDEITGYSVEVCIEHAKRYLARFGRQRRDGEEMLDLMKAAHYCIIAWTKIEEAKPVAQAAIPPVKMVPLGWLVNLPSRDFPGTFQTVHVEAMAVFEAMRIAYPDLKYTEIFAEA